MTMLSFQLARCNKMTLHIQTQTVQHICFCIILYLHESIFVHNVAPPVTVTVTVTGGTVMAGGSHTLICSVSGAPSGNTLTYSWSNGSTTLSSCITSQCTISGVQASDAGDDYMCRVAVSRSGMLIATGLGTGTLRVTCKRNFLIDANLGVL